MTAFLVAVSFFFAQAESPTSRTWDVDGVKREALVYGLRPQIDQYAHQCSKHGVQVPETDYMAGWLVGNGERIRRAAGEGCCSPQ